MTTILWLHIAIAISSVILSGLNLARPSNRKLFTSYAFAGATLISGSALVFIQPSHLASACISGLVYLAIVMALTVAAQRKLAHQTTRR